MFSGKSMSVVGQQGVKYGLQAPAATQEGKPKKKVGMFAGSDDDEDAAAQDMNAAVRAQQGVKRADAQITKAHAAALQEDANCFEYDAFYEGIQDSRKQAELESFKQEQAGPRYLTAMMTARDRRQRIQDMAFNRREALAAKAEDGLYEGKEKFATAAYKKQLEEDKLFADQLAAQDKADEDNTVEKKGMDGFLGVLQSAMAEPLPHDEAGASNAAEAEEKAAADAAAAKLQKRADVALEKRLAAMDKGELKRWQLEQQIRTGQGAEQSSAGMSTSAQDGEKGELAGDAGGAGAEGAAAAGAAAAPAVRKRAAEDKIAAARQRAKERKLQKG